MATVAIVCVLSVFNGFTDLASARLSKVDPDIKAIPINGKVIDSADSLAQAIEAVEGVKRAAPTITENAMAMYGNLQMAVTLRGVPDEYSEVIGIDSAVIDGAFDVDSEFPPTTTISVGTAMRLEAFPGAEGMLRLYVPKRVGKINPANPMAAFMADSMFVAGVYRVDDPDHDMQTVMVSLPAARRLLEYDGGEATAIEIAAKPGVDSDALIAPLQAVVGDNIKLLNRLEQEEQSFKMIQVEKWITFVMLAFILVIASFNVVSTLSMLIIEKRDNMRTLRAMGATGPMIRRIFMWEGWLITMVGGLCGIIVGVALCLAQQWGGFITLNGDPSQLVVSSYPVRVAPIDLLLVAALICAVGWAIGALTSWSAVKKSPFPNIR